MQVTRKSMFSGITRTMDLAITEEEVQSHKNGKLIQYAFPNLDEDEREFYLSGITKEEWEKLHGDTEEMAT